MRYISHKFMITGAISFAVLFALSFTPLAVVPMFFALAAIGKEGMILLIFVTGAPFFGLLALLVIAPRDRRMSGAAELAGIWVGSIFGSVAGLKLAEAA